MKRVFVRRFHNFKSDKERVKEVGQKIDLNKNKIHMIICRFTPGHIQGDNEQTDEGEMMTYVCSQH